MIPKMRAWCKATKTMIEVNKDNIVFIMEHPDEYIVMQDTGLKDRCGDSIYAGDIVRLDGHVWIVYWEDRCACFGLEEPLEETIDTFDTYYGYECEVIGNIYKNPELMEDGCTTE